MTKVFLNIVFILSIVFAFGQNTDEQLANYYFNEGDCDKALPYFEKVYEQNPSEFILNRYLSCLKEKENDKEVLKLIERQASIYPHMVQYQVAIGEEYERQNNQIGRASCRERV